ncbi:hypothetical protein PRUPE_5G131100 [Prunus persica]|uniref:Uncharacterized protein n=1 Tax=Prunus persica TaxID=3760 RepID=A0A251P7Q8_PRUPE|nr:hypothetical protein PRUPE_5G131100 [Prunus persica]
MSLVLSLCKQNTRTKSATIFYSIISSSLLLFFRSKQTNRGREGCASQPPLYFIFQLLFAAKHKKQTHHFLLLHYLSLRWLSSPSLFVFFSSLLTCWRQLPIGRQFNCRAPLLVSDASYKPSLF